MTDARSERVWEIAEKLFAIGKRETTPVPGGFAALSLAVKVTRIMRQVHADPYDVVWLLLAQLESRSEVVPSSKECRDSWESKPGPQLDQQVMRRVSGLFLDVAVPDSDGPAACVMALVLLGREAFQAPDVFVALDWMRAHPSEVDGMGLSDEEIETRIVWTKASN